MRIGLAGYGKMGASIFRLLSNTYPSITVLCIDETEAHTAGKKHTKRLERALKSGQISETAYQTSRRSILFTSHVQDLAGSDVVVEAVYEDPVVKATLFKQLESVLSWKALLLSNTSSISIASLAKHLRHPERFCGLHFFYPVELIDLIEILEGPETSPELPAYLKSWCHSLGKNAILAKDAQGSVVNAILSYYYLEALYILEEGLALPSAVDAAARPLFYVGPCESMDVIGIDFLFAAMRRAGQPGSLLPVDWDGQGRQPCEKQGLRAPVLFERLLSQGRTGKKKSRGIYLYDGQKASDDAPGFYRHLSDGNSAPEHPAQDELLTKRLLYSVLNGTLYSLQQKKASLEDLDLAVKEVLLMKQGPFGMMRDMGLEAVLRDFSLLAARAGKRFEITDPDLLAWTITHDPQR